MIQPAIDLRGVTKAFGKGPNTFYALRGVDFQVDPGELVMIVGPSGSGKTTLLSIMGCVLTPTQGLVELFGGYTFDRSLCANGYEGRRFHMSVGCFQQAGAGVILLGLDGKI